jgi:hypothetical protein
MTLTGRAPARATRYTPSWRWSDAAEVATHSRPRASIAKAEAVGSPVA